MAGWTLDEAYDRYPRIEEEFEKELDASLDPRGPSVLFDFVAGFDLAPGCVAVDVGCGEGMHALSLAERFGFAVTGVDPVPRHVEVAREAAGSEGPTFVLGTAESLPIPDASVDLVWCRDVLVHVADLPSVYAEFRRVLRPGGRWSIRCTAPICWKSARRRSSGTPWAWWRKAPTRRAPMPRSRWPGCASTSASR